LYRYSAVVLEMIGDLPDVDAKPPDDSLFVCRLNPVTTDEDLEIIFSRFGKVTTCDIIRDYKTGDSLNFAFISFEHKEEAEAAYFKMDNVLIDGRGSSLAYAYNRPHFCKPHLSCLNIFTTTEAAKLIAAFKPEV
jgi:peptidyl-prolyl cis-trans isomerase-like 4